MEKITFGQLSISINEVFFRSSLSLGLVNISPVVPGDSSIITNNL